MQTDLAIGNQVHIPLHRSQKWQKHSARLPSRLQRDFKAPTLRARPQNPFPSGHILQGRRINRSVPGRPAVPKRHRRASVMFVGRSQRRSPSGPSTPNHGSPYPRRGASPHNRQPSRRQLHRRPDRESVSKPEGRTTSSTVRFCPHQSLHPPAAVPRLATLGVALHLVSAHPPCSRKGPLLPTCGSKRPRRVKRETTNSRFSHFVGLGQNQGGQKEQYYPEGF